MVNLLSIVLYNYLNRENKSKQLNLFATKKIYDQTEIYHILTDIGLTELQITKLCRLLGVKQIDSVTKKGGTYITPQNKQKLQNKLIRIINLVDEESLEYLYKKFDLRTSITPTESLEELLERFEIAKLDIIRKDVITELLEIFKSIEEILENEQKQEISMLSTLRNIKKTKLGRLSSIETIYSSALHKPKLVEFRELKTDIITQLENYNYLKTFQEEIPHTIYWLTGQILKNSIIFFQTVVSLLIVKFVFEKLGFLELEGGKLSNKTPKKTSKKTTKKAKK